MFLNFQIGIQLSEFYFVWSRQNDNSWIGQWLHKRYHVIGKYILLCHKQWELGAAAGPGVAVVPIFIKLNWYKSWLEKNVDRLLLINWGQLHNGVAIYSGVLFSSVLLFLIFEFANSSSTDKINMHNCSCSNEEKEESTHLFLFYCVTIQNRHCGLHFSQGLALVHSGVGVGTELTSSQVHWSPSYKKLSEMWYAALYTVHATVQRIISDITPRCVPYTWFYGQQAAGHRTGRGSGRNMSWIWSNAGQVNSLLNTGDWRGDGLQGEIFFKKI